MFEKGYKPTKDEMESAEGMMGKEEREMSIKRENYYREPIESLEEFDEEYKKIDDFIESLKEQFPEGFQPFKVGFWPKLFEIMKKEEKKSIPVNTPEDEIETKGRKFLAGGSKISHDGVFINRLWAHYLIDELKKSNLINDDSVTTFYNAFPHGASKHYHDSLVGQYYSIDIERSKSILITVLERELACLESIKMSENGKEINRLLEAECDKTQAFFYAIFGVDVVKEGVVEQGDDYQRCFRKIEKTNIEPKAVFECVEASMSRWSILGSEFGHYREVVTINYDGLDKMVEKVKRKLIINSNK